MGILRLAHFAVRTPDLEASRRFYEDLLGLKPGYRPSFGFPGAWLYPDGDTGGQGAVHLIDASETVELERYLGSRGGEGLDHIALEGDDWPEVRRRCISMGVAVVERTAPEIELHQVFLTDPSGLMIELNFPKR